MTFKINADRTVAVAQAYYWQPMNSCPLGVKVQLLNSGGVAVYAVYDGKDLQWQGWAPLPRERKGVCRRCGGQMEPGKAIRNPLGGIPDFPDGSAITLSPSERFEFVDVMKCQDCGHSVTD